MDKTVINKEAIKEVQPLTLYGWYCNQVVGQLDFDEWEKHYRNIDGYIMFYMDGRSSWIDSETFLNILNTPKTEFLPTASNRAELPKADNINIKRFCLEQAHRSVECNMGSHKAEDVAERYYEWIVNN